MALVELVMPKMGESIMEATILKWTKQVGDAVEADETILEIATDKVDSEVPSPTSGVLAEIKFQENEVVPIGKVIALINTDAENRESGTGNREPRTENRDVEPQTSNFKAEIANNNGNGHALQPEFSEVAPAESSVAATRFYSPLVKNIAKQENISITELETISGTGQEGRVTKKDMLQYVENRKSDAGSQMPASPTASLWRPKDARRETLTTGNEQIANAPVSSIQHPASNIEIIEMDRMRRLIADHMVLSKHTSPHVTSFVEVDVTNLVQWRERVKGEFEKRYGEKITFTPIFVEAVVKAIQDFPLVNVSVEGNSILRKKYINIGMATALPSGNLIVPVIKNADKLNLAGLTQAVNDLANRARQNKLKPEEIQDGTFTLTNVGTFGNVMGTPIINQPQVAILATGAIRKKPAVIETEFGDLIAVRQLMFLSLSYDHRVVDGALGGSFLRRIGDYLENFDAKRSV
jgi:2-oxoglutarate dehydrogenase E2 component (dihydrolipoamide succinyltransferase)